MLTDWTQLIADELASGTGAAIAVRESRDRNARRGLRIWFDDLDELCGPVAELHSYGQESHAIRLVFGPFSAPVLAKITAADGEDVELARALLRSVARVAQVSLSSGDMYTWSAAQPGFEVNVLRQHHDQHPDAEGAIMDTCRDVIVPLMAAMAELIGYESIEVDEGFIAPQVEGAIDRATVRRRERSPRNRLLCLGIHGRRCKACNLNPVEIYGEGVDIIEVHHLVPLALLAEPRAYNPETDLVPLCPNCHRAVHKQRPQPIEIEVLRKVIQAHRD